jgi:hypothetical protein
MVVAIYDPSKPLLSLYVNGTLTSSIPAVVARDTRTLTQTYVGRSNWGSDAYSNVNVNYLSVYNRVLTSDEINRPLPTPQITLKGTPLFNQLSPSATSSAVGAFSLRAVNGVSTRAVAVQGHPVVQWSPTSLSGFSTTLSGQPYGNGTYTVSSSETENGGGRASWNLFNIGTDANLSGHYHSPTTSGLRVFNPDYIGSATTTINGVSVSGLWVQIQLPNPVVLKSYQMITRTAYSLDRFRFPDNFYIVGSNNGTTWVQLDYKTYTNTDYNTLMTPIVVAGETRSQLTISIENSVSYTYYRLVVQSLISGDILNFSNFWLYGDAPSYAPNPAQDFYADERGNLLTAPVTGIHLKNWLGSATGYVTKWYDQSGKGNDASQNTAANQPIIQRATKGPGYMCVFSGAQSLSSSTLSLYNTPYSFALTERSTSTGTVTFSVNRNPVFSYSGGTISTNGSLYYGRISTGSQYALDQVANSLDPPSVTAFTNSVSEPLRYHYGMKSAASAWKKYIYNDPLGPLTATNTDTVLVSSNTGKTFNIGYLYLDTGVTNYYYGEIYELLVFTQSLYDLDNTGGLITQVYQNQLSAYGT